MSRYIPRKSDLTLSMESLTAPLLPELIRNEFTGQYEVSMEGLGDALTAIKKWLAELGAKIKKLFSGESVKTAATNMAASNLEKKAEENKSSGSASIMRVSINTIIRVNYEKITMSKYSQYIIAAQGEILALIKALANSHDTVHSALRNKSSDVNLPDINTTNLNKYMDISSNGSTISVNMQAATATLSVAPSEIKSFGDLTKKITDVNTNQINPLLKRVSDANLAIMGMNDVDPLLVKLSGSLQVQIIKLANISKLVFFTEINRALNELNKTV